MAPCKSKTRITIRVDDDLLACFTNSGVEHVTRFPASDPSKAENFKTGINNNGLGIDSQGNVWVTNRFGTGPPGMAHLIEVDYA